MLPCRAAHLCTVNGISIVTMFTLLAVVPLGQGCGTCRTAGPGHAADACAHQTGWVGGGGCGCGCMCGCVCRERGVINFAVTLYSCELGQAAHLSTNVSSDIVIPKVWAGNRTQD